MIVYSFVDIPPPHRFSGEKLSAEPPDSKISQSWALPFVGSIPCSIRGIVCMQLYHDKNVILRSAQPWHSSA